MRNKYNKEFEDFIKKNVSKYTKEDFRILLQKRYNIKLSSEALRRYLNRHKISDRYRDYKEHNVRDTYKCLIGTERVTSQGVFIKTAQPDTWRRKTRVIYEKYHNCKLKDNEYIVFLNQNQNDFRKENLIKSSRKEIAYLHNKKMFSSDPELTKLGIITAQLMIKVNEVSKR